ncbi:uncharacterized protein IL334_004234 [Kwoniella shivajii]|uniref:F-box domain-containing protein n=1 Tax=Kwoniella shivajii TaxID=564305 RepID=A0ABZ1CZS4_9TREE|nr:hypothetical protein IL334_004234 [Kwoniella shivajii]
MSTGPTLTDIPNEVVLEHLLPVLDLKSIISLSSVNRQFNDLTSDPTFWRTKTLNDFTFPSTSHPSSSNRGWWKRVYLGLLSPKAFVWGSSDNHRLGGAEKSTTIVNSRNGRFIDLPTEINWNNNSDRVGRSWKDELKDSLTTALKGFSSQSISTSSISSNVNIVREGIIGEGGVVELQAGGWSFTTRTSDGSVWVWGQLDGSRPGFRSPSWEDKYCPCPEPTKIPLPCKAESISAGRRHLLILDSDNLIWELTSWGKAYHHTSPELTSPSGHGITKSPPHIIQLSTGWVHSAALSIKGDIHIWYPFSSTYENALTRNEDLSGPLNNHNEDENQDQDRSRNEVNIPDDGRGLKYGKVGNDVVHTLPPLPLRPQTDTTSPTTLSSHTSDSGAARFGTKRLQELSIEWQEYQSSRSTKIIEEEQKIIKIASGEDFVVALKKNGEVWLTKVKEGEAPYWQYMQYFSSPSITHITAQFRSFTTYATPTATSSKSAVYHTIISEYSANLGERTLPKQLESLQNKGIIQVAIGDYHYAALTDKGEMLTWGQGDSGQLGRGKDKSGSEPVKVIFPQERQSERNEQQDESFVFSITAGGWHTGALVLGDLKPRSKDQIVEQKGDLSINQVKQDNKDIAEEEHGNMPGGFPYNMNPVPVPPNRGGSQIRAMPFFRVGFAGRGANTGGAGRGNHTTQDQDQTQGQGAGVVPGATRGDGPLFRVGFAGRGANTAAGRGRGAGGNETHEARDGTPEQW